MDAPAVGRDPARAPLLAPRPGRREPGDLAGRVRRRPYISDYNIWMHHLVDDKGERLFPPKMRLLTHWNLRDEIKADYADAQQGLAKQRAIQTGDGAHRHPDHPASRHRQPGRGLESVDEHGAAGDGERRGAAGGARRQPLCGAPSPTRATPGCSPPSTPSAAPTRTRPSHRRSSPAASTRSASCPKRASRPCWSRWSPRRSCRRWRSSSRSGWAASSSPSTSGTTASRRAAPTPRNSWTPSAARSTRPPAAFEADIPNLLTKLGFTPAQRARAGRQHRRRSGARLRPRHGGAMRSEKAHLRTRVGKDGMDYKGYNIAVHELGHNVEQIFSLNRVDHTLLPGVPNNAFTEALAFVFQGHDLELLGLASPDAAQRGDEDAQRFLGHVRDRRRRAGGHRGVALDVRPPGGDPGRARDRPSMQIAKRPGTSTTRRSSARRTWCCSASTRT